MTLDKQEVKFAETQKVVQKFTEVTADIDAPKLLQGQS